MDKHKLIQTDSSSLSFSLTHTHSFFLTLTHSGALDIRGCRKTTVIDGVRADWEEDKQRLSRPQPSRGPITP